MIDEAKYIEDLISQGEHQQLDFKYEISDSRKIAISLVAFANTDGGRLLIGVKDNGKIAGIRTEEEYYMIEAAATMYSQPEIQFETFRRKIGGKTILEIIIQPSDQKPHFAQDPKLKWLAYHRVGDQNILASSILLQVWKREKRHKGTYIEYSKNEEAVLDYLELNGPSSLHSISLGAGLKKRIVSTILVNLVSLHVIQMIFTEKGEFFKLEEKID